MDTSQTEANCATFLSIASRDLKEGRYLHAKTIFSALTKIDFSWKHIASQGEAVATARMGEYEGAFSSAEKMLQKLVTQTSEQTVFKADTLKSLAEVSIGLRHLDKIDDILKEAADIYFDQGLTKANASVIQLQGLVALQRGDVQEAMDKFSWARTLSEIKIPEIVPYGFGIEAAPEPSVSETQVLVPLAAARP